MPKSSVSKKKLFREFSRLNQRYVNKNYLKHLRKETLKMQADYEIFNREFMFMLWAYDLEFFTLNHASESFGYARSKIGEKIVYPLANEGYIYKHFDKLTPSTTREDHLFREETKHNYRVRYALTQKARMLVQTFYRRLEGSVNAPAPDTSSDSSSTSYG
tara:strand:+ start:291 stop:770 length:480 start_codon:yes stop_codon:yes gene_type:complete